MLSEKQCPQCLKIKPLEECYYKSGKSYQKYCKPCQNQIRKKYAFNSIQYRKVPTGFDKLPLFIRQNILDDINNKIPYRHIAHKYSVSYNTILFWKKRGKFKIEENI